MDPQPLYDLAPAARLALLGIAVAAGPLLWLGLRYRGASPARRLAALTLITLFLTFDLILFGAFTRLTDSGLGCPDWPGCYGSASPVGARVQISEAQAQLPTGPVTHAKAWIEMVHRYLATGVGVLITTLTVAAWALRRHKLAVSPWWPTLTLVWVCVQGAFGALTVTMKLFPAIVTLHLLGGLLLLVLLCRQTAAYHLAARGQVRAVIAPTQRRVLWVAAAAVWIQVALGAWVSTNYAVLACSEFPTCQGSWWPAMNFTQGFELWRELGMTGQGNPIEFAALTAIHYAHRLAAYGVLPLLGLCAWVSWRGPLRHAAAWIAGLALWQLVTGLSNVVLGWPLLAAVSHTGGAAALVGVLAWMLSVSQTAAMQVPLTDVAVERRAGPGQGRPLEAGR